MYLTPYQLVGNATTRAAPLIWPSLPNSVVVTHDGIPELRVDEEIMRMLELSSASSWGDSDFEAAPRSGLPMEDPRRHPAEDRPSRRRPPTLPIDAARLQEREQRAALRWLHDFEQTREEHLPQLTGGVLANAKLAAGKVDFRNITDLCSAFPCGVMEGLGAGVGAVQYPRGPRQLPVVCAARLRGREVFVLRDPEHPGQIRYTTDFRRWHRTGAYDDGRIQGAKLAMWERIVAQAADNVSAAMRRDLSD